MGNTDKLVKITIFSIAVVILISFLFIISNIVKLLIIAALLSYILDPLANYFESRRLNRTSATIAIFVIISTLIGVTSLVFLPVLSQEIMALQDGFITESAELMISRLENFIINKLAFIGFSDLHLLGRIQDATAKFGDWIFTHLFDAASVITSIILMPFIVFFLLKDGRRYKKAFVSIVPNRYFEFSLYLLHKLNIQVGNYLRGQMLDALFVGIIAVFSLWVIGVKYFFMIGVFAGLANLIPYFGPLVGVILAVIVSILQTGSFSMAFYIIGVFIVIKIIDDVFLQPVIVAKSVHMSPLIVLLAVLIGGKLFGILGMLLAVPFTSFIKVVVHESVLNYQRYK